MSQEFSNNISLNSPDLNEQYEEVYVGEIDILGQIDQKMSKFQNEEFKNISHLNEKLDEFYEQFDKFEKIINKQDSIERDFEHQKKKIDNILENQQRQINSKLNDVTSISENLLKQFTSIENENKSIQDIINLQKENFSDEIKTLQIKFDINENKFAKQKIKLNQFEKILSDNLPKEVINLKNNQNTVSCNDIKNEINLDRKGSSLNSLEDKIIINNDVKQDFKQKSPSQKLDFNKGTSDPKLNSKQSKSVISSNFKSDKIENNQQTNESELNINGYESNINFIPHQLNNLNNIDIASADKQLTENNNISNMIRQAQIKENIQSTQLLNHHDLNQHLKENVHDEVKPKQNGSFHHQETKQNNLKSKPSKLGRLKPTPYVRTMEEESDHIEQLESILIEDFNIKSDSVDSMGSMSFLNGQEDEEKTQKAIKCINKINDLKMRVSKGQSNYSSQADHDHEGKMNQDKSNHQDSKTFNFLDSKLDKQKNIEVGNETDRSERKAPSSTSREYNGEMSTKDIIGNENFFTNLNLQEEEDEIDI